MNDNAAANNMTNEVKIAPDEPEEKPSGPRRRTGRHIRSSCQCKIPEPRWVDNGDAGGHHECARCHYLLNTDSHGYGYRRLPGDLDAFQSHNEEMRDIIDDLPEWEKQKLVGLNGRKLVKAINAATRRYRAAKAAEEARGGPPALGPKARRRLAQQEAERQSIAEKLAIATGDPTIAKLNDDDIREAAIDMPAWNSTHVNADDRCTIEKIEDAFDAIRGDPQTHERVDGEGSRLLREP